jgi:XTP/dITP diphosphohydrolase
MIASQNPGKIEEFRALLAGLRIELVDPIVLGLDLQVMEDKASYLANARKKARAFAEQTGFLTLADDSGLEVDVLDGAPGVYSARLAGKGKTDADRRSLLLEMLRPHPPPWRAHFRCALVLQGPDGFVGSGMGECEGEIIPHERGSAGFGYDPIFLVKTTQKTMAELSMQEKNRLSHRARALQVLLPRLKQLLG